MTECMETLFHKFIQQNCEIRNGAWIQLDVLHCAFLDFCLINGQSVDWVNQYIALDKGITLSLSAKEGGLRKGTKSDCIIVTGIGLVSYPF